MTRALLLVAALLLAPPASHAQADTPEARRAAAVELAETLGLGRQMDQMMQQMRGALVQGIHRSAPQMVEREVAALVDEFLMPEFRENLPRLTEAMALLWAQELTTEEMRGVREFYATPLGRKLLDAQPRVGAQAYGMGRAWGERIAQDAIAKHRDALRQRGVNL